MEINHIIFSKEILSCTESTMKVLSTFAPLGCSGGSPREKRILSSLLSTPLVLASVWPFCLTCFCFRGGCSREVLAQLTSLSSESRQRAAFVSGLRECVGQSGSGRKHLHLGVCNKQHCMLHLKWTLGVTLLGEEQLPYVGDGSPNWLLFLKKQFGII